MSQQVSSESRGSQGSMMNAFEDFNKEIKYEDFKNDIDHLKKKIVTATNL